jgi:hypothetical protein
MTPLQGMLGMAPDDPSNGPSYVSALHDSNIIDNRQVGMIFGQEDNTPQQITFGGYDESYIKNTDFLHKYKSINSSRWELDL